MSENDCVLQSRSLCKTFLQDRRRFTVFGTLRHRIGRNSGTGDLFFALRDIQIEVARGEKVAVIGDNGAGKSTLLRLIAGIYEPDSGELAVKGAVTLLAGLGIGMIDELSVTENLFLYGMIYGMERKQIERVMGEMIEWAELQNFAESKLKHLSSGMKARLAFSAVRYIEKDIYLFDEALAAGDKNFKEKCALVFRNYKETNKTFLVATHDLKFAKSFCNKALWLHHGRQMSFGDPEEVVARYEESKPK
ncbi:ATP-binding cassette domain-containing protein [bacterium]|nr:ATP-binding cassette domain-containing protein [bacterium]MCI0607173.1 ATP-binding cassette domain-containing protein [bacterium]